MKNICRKSSKAWGWTINAAVANVRDFIYLNYVENSSITDPLFREAVEAINAGNLPALRNLLEANPPLVSRRLDYPTEGYFKNPFLLWFIANNPIRQEETPKNIYEITKLLIQFVRRHSSDNFQEQIDYTLGWAQYLQTEDTLFISNFHLVHQTVSKAYNCAVGNKPGW